MTTTVPTSAGSAAPQPDGRAEPGEPEFRVCYELSMVARTALHVGGAAGTVTADLALARDGMGRLYVPGTSLAGVLRHAASALLPVGPGEVDALFGARSLGAQSGKDAGGPADTDDAGSTGRGDGGDGATASRVTVDDAVVDPAGPVELRTGVGIDRVTGAAADRIRYDRQVLPAGSRLTLALRYDGPDDAEALWVLDSLVAAVRHRGLRVGAGTRRGFGRLACTAAARRKVDLRSRAELLAWFGGQAAWEDVAAEPVDGDELRISLTWRPGRPVVVGASASAASAGLVPLLTASPDGAGLVPTLPGSAVKGVLRSVAERIARTLCDPEARWDAGGAPGTDFVAAMDELAARVPAIDALFGSRRRAGAVSVADVTADVIPTPAAAWERYLTAGNGRHPSPAAGNGQNRAAAAAGPDPADPDPADTAEAGAAEAGWLRERTHVGIDRWTGGAADELLFTVQETTGVRWPPLVVEVDVARLRHALPPAGGWDADARCRAAVVLLGLALGALVDGTVGLGHATTRGLGEVEVDAFHIDAPTDIEVPSTAYEPGGAMAGEEDDGGGGAGMGYGGAGMDGGGRPGGLRPVEAAWWDWLRACKSGDGGDWVQALTAGGPSAQPGSSRSGSATGGAGSGATGIRRGRNGR
jgi:CRISPR/Cas system CSM-associated protein Csm3 (group 7 of RAMP superfamily)